MSHPLLLGGAMLGLAAGTFGFRLAGPALRSRISFPPGWTALLQTASVVLLAALVATTGLFDGQHLAGVARPAAVLVGGLVAWRGMPFVAVVLAAAVTAAGLRMVGLR